MPASKPIFTVRLAGCGTERLKEMHKFPRSTHDYARIRENNILILVWRVLEQLCTAFVRPDRRASFYYDLVCFLLSKLALFDWAYLAPDIYTLPARIGQWGLSRPKGPKKHAKNFGVELVEAHRPSIRKMPDVRTTRR